MAHTAEHVRGEALQLTPEERLRLAQDLHDSVLTAEEREIQQAWADVAAQRYDDWKAGRATMHSAMELPDPERWREAWGAEIERRRQRLESGEDRELTLEEFLRDDLD